jgi:hypothetical protein
MPVIKAAQPIRRYGPPSWVVWTTGEPCTEEDCVALSVAVEQGEVELVERGQWGPYHAILCWRHPNRRPSFFLVEFGDATAQ